MSAMSAKKLVLEREHLQQQLRAQRQLISEKFCTGPGHSLQFPRSATMRFLTEKTGFKLVADIALRQICARYPGVTAIAQSLRRLV
jgi:hypothetical protein